MDKLCGKNIENSLINVDKEKLSDIENLMPEAEMELSEKIKKFVSGSGNQPYVHQNEGYTVIVKMSGEIDATDAFKDYLRKRTELMY